MQYGQTKEHLPQTWRPFVRNFSPQEYSAGAQNWCSVQDKNGIVYFGNTKGVLQFDGINWKTISIGDEKAVFSLAIDSVGNIWCGSHDDLGYLKPDSLGQLLYTSIEYLFADSLKPLGRIRQIIPTREGLFIRTSKNLYRKKNDSITVWKSKTNFYKMQYVNNDIYVYEHRIALKVLNYDSLIIAPSGVFFKDYPPTSILPFGNDSLLVTTWKEGIFLLSDSTINKFPTSVDNKFKDNPIIEAKLLNSGKILLAGFNKGSYVIDRKGNLLQYFNKSTGLIDEFCNSTLIDQRNGLWFCNNYGISRVEIESPFSFWGRNEGINTNVRFITKFKNKLLAATSDKIYSISEYIDFNSYIIKPIEGISACWFILPIGDIILAATNFGVYEIKNNVSRLLALGQKKSFHLLRSQIDSNKVYVGTEEGIAIVRLKNGKWKYEGQIRGVDAEIRQMFELEDGTLWLGTHNQGIIKSKINNMDAKSELIKRSDGFQKLNSYRMVLLDDQLFFNSPLSPTLLYNEYKSEFVYDTLLFNKNEYISRIVKDRNENIWVRKSSNNGTQILYGIKDDKLSYQFETFPYGRLIGLNAQFIFPDNNTTWFGTRFGLINYDSNVNLEIPKVYPAQIRNVRVGDSILYAGHRLNIEQNKIPEIQYEKNVIRFEYALGAFEKREALSFQYYLEGYEDQWSEWSYESQKDYTNLFEGSYKFHVRGSDIYGTISGEDVYSFIILPPWYRSTTAYILYFISFVLLIFAVDRIRTSQLNKKNKIEEERKLKQQAAIEKAKSDERQRVRKKTAADFHDELGHMLTKITLFTEMAKRSTHENSGAQKYLEGVGKNASQLSSGMKDLIWTLDSDKDSLYDALIRIKDFGEVLFEHSAISFGTKGFPEELNKVKISMDMRRHLVLIFKEVMNNCLKYSECNNAEFSVLAAFDKIQIIFTDDGKGFDIDSIKKGNGIKNIKMRAENMGSDIKILSENGQTGVQLTIKHNNKNIPNG